MMGRLKSDQGQLFYEFHLGVERILNDANDAYNVAADEDSDRHPPA
jgi:hypothetical protein